MLVSGDMDDVPFNGHQKVQSKYADTPWDMPQFSWHFVGVILG